MYDLEDKSIKNKKQKTIIILKWLTWVDREMDHRLISSIPVHSVATAANFWCIARYL